jgi:hypothetical protein
VARDQENASPIAGAWSGPANAFKWMEVSVQVRLVGSKAVVLARLGNAIYWIGCIAAGITVVVGAFEAVS